MRKKLLTATLTILMVFSLAACGGNQKGSDEADAMKTAEETASVEKTVEEPVTEEFAIEEPTVEETNTTEYCRMMVNMQLLDFEERTEIIMVR